MLQKVYISNECFIYSLKNSEIMYHVTLNTEVMTAEKIQLFHYRNKLLFKISLYYCFYLNAALASKVYVLSSETKH